MLSIHPNSAKYVYLMFPYNIVKKKNIARNVLCKWGKLVLLEMKFPILFYWIY